MEPFEQIVVALGSVDGDTPLIEYAALLARLGSTKEVRFVHVAEPSASVPALRARMRDHVAQTFQGTNANAECDVLHGSLTDRLLAYVTEVQADLILIGAKKHKLSARLAMVAPCSVGVVPDGYPAQLTHMLIAFDFSSASKTTLQWATALVASTPGVRTTALHVMTQESTDLFGGHESDEEQADTMRRMLAESNRHGVAVEPRMAHVSRTTDVGRSHPFSPLASIAGADVAHAIIAEADACGADCIVMSTRGRSRSASILLGSVTEKVIERTTVPLLVGKSGGRNLGLAAILLGRAGDHAGVKAN